MPCGAQGVKGFDDDEDYDDDCANFTVNIRMVSFFHQPIIANSIQIKLCKYFFPMPPHALCGLRGPPCWAWQYLNQLQWLGRP